MGVYRKNKNMSSFEGILVYILFSVHDTVCMSREIQIYDMSVH
jgi:hypothetical protein